MKKALRILSCLLVSVLCISVMLTGCQKTNEVEATIQNTTSAANTTAAPVEPKIIKMYAWGAASKDKDLKAIEAFETENPAIKVSLEYPVENNSDEYNKKINLLLLSGDDVDIVGTSNFTHYSDNARRGNFKPLDSFIKQEGMEYDQIYKFSTKIENIIFGLPQQVTLWFVMINKNHLDEAGLPVPPLNWTWADYKEYAKKMTKGEGKDIRYGSYFHTWKEFSLVGLYSTKLDHPFFKPNASLDFDNPILKEGLKFRYELEQVDKCQTPLIDIKASKLTYRDQFFNGKVSMVPIGSWMVAEIGDTTKFPHDFKTAFASFPRWDESTPEGRTTAEAQMWSVAKNSKHPEEAYKFIRFYTTEAPYITGSGLTAETKADIKKLMPIILAGKPENLYDMNSLNAVFENPNIFLNVMTILPDYSQQIQDMFLEETDKYYVGGQSLDQCMETLKKRGEDIIQKAKK